MYCSSILSPWNSMTIARMCILCTRLFSLPWKEPGYEAKWESTNPFKLFIFFLIVCELLSEGKYSSVSWCTIWPESHAGWCSWTSRWQWSSYTNSNWICKGIICIHLFDRLQKSGWFCWHWWSGHTLQEGQWLVIYIINIEMWKVMTSCTYVRESIDYVGIAPTQTNIKAQDSQAWQL